MKQAIAVSGFTILTGSIARYFSTINNRHPEKDSTTIEYGLSNVMLPAVLVGSNLGVFFNMIMPATVGDQWYIGVPEISSLLLLSLNLH